ncbi:MAG: S-layer homology domain-containing protein [Oscillospiraceae bacterium]|nr:S-layer homology domain-containing protein [Oscillospiraceae bacterium]
MSDFSDVKGSDWFYQAVSFVTANGMFNGTSTATFSPNGTMTRGMFVTVLGRYCGAPAVSEGASLGTVIKTDVNMRSAPSTKNSNVLYCLQTGAVLSVTGTTDDLTDEGFSWYCVKYNGVQGYIRSDLMEVTENDFSDVSASAYYYSYVQWACSSGIASATGDGTFSPERNITREEICSMLYNYASCKNYQLDPVVSAVSFTDSSTIFSGYSSAVSSMQRVGVVNGYTDGTFRPKGSATRGEVSAMLMRFLDAIGYKKVTESSYDSYGKYIFGTEVPQKSAVGTDYFSDACFIGHSLVNGMQSTFGLSATDFYAKNSATAKYFLGISDFALPTTNTDSNGNIVCDTGTLEQALSLKSYAKVYIMLGINEIGSSDSSRQSLYSSMNSIISLVRKTQPGAVVYIISLSPVSKKCSEASESINRDNILDFNAVLKQLCKDTSSYYLNVFDLLCDSGGFLSESTATDGIHLLSPDYAKIKSYLLTHTI